MICFLHAKEESTAEIYHQLASVYSDNVMIRKAMEKLSHEFQKGRCDVHDEIRCTGPPYVTNEIIKKW